MPNNARRDIITFERGGDKVRWEVNVNTIRVCVSVDW